MVIDLDEGEALVADCKYKKLEPAEIRNHDISQVLAYRTATGGAEGLLIYPAQEVTVRNEVSIRNSSVRIRQTTVDLDGSLGQLRQSCDAFADDVFTLVLH